MELGSPVPGPRDRIRTTPLRVIDAGHRSSPPDTTSLAWTSAADNGPIAPTHRAPTISEGEVGHASGLAT